jgi:hypothetical protein
MNTHFYKRGISRLFMALVVAVFAINLTACDEDNGGSSNQGTVSGTLTFKWHDVTMSHDSMKVHFPHGTPDTSDFPGFIRLGIAKSNDDGVALGGPVQGHPGLGNGVGYDFSQLSNGILTYTISNVDNGKYIMLPTYENPFVSGFGKHQLLGHYGDSAYAGYGQPIVVSGNDVTGIDIDVNVTAAWDSLQSAQTAQTSTLSGTITITNIGNWPTTPTSLIIRGYKDSSSVGGMPELYTPLTKPDSGNEVSYSISGVNYGTWELIEVTLFTPPGTATTIAGGEIVTKASPIVVDEATEDLGSITITLP